jgi:hypothetical protein
MVNTEPECVRAGGPGDLETCLYVIKIRLKELEECVVEVGGVEKV